MDREDTKTQKQEQYIKSMITKNFNTPGLKGYLEGEPITTPYLGGIGGVKSEEVSPLWTLGSKGIDFNRHCAYY